MVTMNKWIIWQKLKNPMESSGTPERWLPPGASAGAARFPLFSCLDQTSCKELRLIVTCAIILISIHLPLIPSVFSKQRNQNNNIQENVQGNRESVRATAKCLHGFQYNFLNSVPKGTFLNRSLRHWWAVAALVTMGQKIWNNLLETGLFFH